MAHDRRLDAADHLERFETISNMHRNTIDVLRDAGVAAKWPSVPQDASGKQVLLPLHNSTTKHVARNDMRDAECLQGENGGLLAHGPETRWMILQGGVTHC